MAFAQVQNGIVTAISQTQINNVLQECGDMVQVGWIFANNTFSPPPQPMPIIATPVLSIATQAQVALSNSDIVVVRCYENNIPVPANWVDYRASLRAVLKSNLGPLPMPPSNIDGTIAYPPGT